MDVIQECVAHFLNLVNITSYIFHLANKNISWILEPNYPVTDEYLAKSEFYSGRKNDEKDVEKRNNSYIICDYIIESQLRCSRTIVYIFLKHRKGGESPCGIISVVVKKNVSYGGQNLYWMLKKKIVNGSSTILYQNLKYSYIEENSIVEYNKL